MKQDWQLRLIQLLSVPGMLLAFYLYLFHQGVLVLGCKVGSIFDCGQVSGPGAPYASIGPVPVAFIGLSGYAVIFLLTWLRDWDSPLMDYLPELLVAVTGFALLFSMGLTAVELFLIHAFCQYCVVSAVLVVVLFGLSLSYLRSANAEGKMMRLELVKDWMSREVITAVPTMGLLDADTLMRENKIRRLPVAENGRVLGIVTFGDIREAKPSAATSLSTREMNHLMTNLKLGEVMAHQPQTISPEATIGEAADIMLTHRISGLPVVDSSGQLVGIITESDIFRMVAHQWRQMTDEESPKPYTHYEEE